MIYKKADGLVTLIANKVINNTNLSDGAFRVYCYLSSKQDGSEVTYRDVRQALGITVEKVSKYFRELEHLEIINYDWESDNIVLND